MVRSPASNKKGGRECRHKKGDVCVEGAGLASSTTLFRQSAAPWASFTNCQKKGAVPPAPSTTHRPLTEGNRTKVMEEIPTGRRRHDKKSLV